MNTYINVWFHVSARQQQLLPSMIAMLRLYN